MPAIKNPSALAILAGRIAAALAPPNALLPSQWMAKYLVVPDGPRAGQMWDRSQSPALGDIVDLLRPGTPYTKITVRKSSQLGYTTALIGVLCFMACEAPARCLLVLPTTNLAIGFNRDKLQPSIDASPVVKSRVFSISSKGSDGSTALHKAFAGGSLKLTGSNSAAGLQSMTIKVAICDEIDQYPRNLEGQGSPMGMIDARQIAFHSSRNYIKLQGGTPTIKGASLVDDEFEAGDQRYWMMPCPHCAASIKFEFGGYRDADNATGLRFNRAFPAEAHYVAQCCGAVIDAWQKDGMIDSGAFVALRPEPGRQPSLHLDAMSSKLTTWDKMGEAYIEAGDDPQKLKNFFNYWLGLPYEEKADAPDYKGLYQRAEGYAERVIPPDALIVTAGVDVQKFGLYIEIVGWTPDRRSYTLFFAYLPAGTTERAGDTSDPDAPCWQRLSEIFEKPLADSFGGERRIDAIGIDCRYNSPVVYDWVRRHHGAYALRTEDGWGRVPMATPKKVDFDWRGKRMRHSAMQWQVGSYNLKAKFYAYLRRECARDSEGLTLVPPGYCHFGSFLPEPYYQQLTAEYIGQDKKGARVWKSRSAENHALDCRVLNMALAFGSAGFDIDNRPENFWRDLASERGGLAALEPLLRTGAQAQVAARQPVPAAKPSPSRDGTGPRDGGWGFKGSWIN